MWSHYHYTPPQLDVAELPRLEHVREQMEDGMVYFPRPSELNDDLDCRPRMARPSTVQALAYGLRRGVEKFGGRERRSERKRRRDAAVKRAGNRAWLQEMWNRAAEEFGILSLSKNDRNSHMWDKYADGGTGLCIEYNFEAIIDTAEVDWIFLEVEYEDEQPELNILDFQRPDPELVSEFVRRSFRVKTKKWAEEEEVRVAFNVGERVSPKVEVPSNTIKALYLGPRLTTEDRETILRWETDVKVHEAVTDGAGELTGFRSVRQRVHSPTGTILQ